MMGKDEPAPQASVASGARTVQPIIARIADGFQTMGEGMFVEFPSVVAAGVRMRLAMPEANGRLQANALEAKLRSSNRLGVHLVDVLVEGR